MESPQERGPERDTKQKEACDLVCENAKKIFEDSEKIVEEEKNFSPTDEFSTKRYSIDNAFDYSVALAQRERQESEKLLESVKEKNEYYEEKITNKLKTFLKKEETLLRALAEMESNFPELASLIKTQKPYLEDKIKEMEKKMNT